MGEKEDLLNLVNHIIDSYEIRVKTVGALMMEAVRALKDSQLEQQELIARLREHLAKGSSLRKKDFDAMMESILTQHSEREKEAIQVIGEFYRGGETMVTELRRFFNNEGKLPSLEDFSRLKTVILVQQAEREREVAEALREFHREQEELNSGLNKLLSKGERAAIKDFKSMIKALQVQHKERESEFGNVLKELERAGEQVSREWQTVMPETIALGRGLTASPLER